MKINAAIQVLCNIIEGQECMDNRYDGIQFNVMRGGYFKFPEKKHYVTIVTKAFFAATITPYIAGHWTILVTGAFVFCTVIVCHVHIMYL